MAMTPEEQARYRFESKRCPGCGHPIYAVRGGQWLPCPRCDLGKYNGTAKKPEEPAV